MDQSVTFSIRSRVVGQWTPKRRKLRNQFVSIRGLRHDPAACLLAILQWRVYQHHVWPREKLCQNHDGHCAVCLHRWNDSRIFEAFGNGYLLEQLEIRRLCFVQWNSWRGSLHNRRLWQSRTLVSSSDWPLWRSGIQLLLQTYLETRRGWSHWGNPSARSMWTLGHHRYWNIWY